MLLVLNESKYFDHAGNFLLCLDTLSGNFPKTLAHRSLLGYNLATFAPGSLRVH